MEMILSGYFKSKLPRFKGDLNGAYPKLWSDRPSYHFDYLGMYEFKVT